MRTQGALLSKDRHGWPTTYIAYKYRVENSVYFKMYKQVRGKETQAAQKTYLLCSPAINIPAALPWDPSTIIQLILLDYPCTTTASASQELKSSFLFLACGNLSSLWRCLYSMSTRDKGSNITLMNSWNSNHSRLCRQKKKNIFSDVVLISVPQVWIVSGLCMFYEDIHTHMLNGSKYNMLFNKSRYILAWKVKPHKIWNRKKGKVLT